MVLVHIGNAVPPPGSCQAAGIVKEERMKVWINRARKKEGRKEGKGEERHIHVYYGIHILNISTCLSSSLTPTVFKEMI